MVTGRVFGGASNVLITARCPQRAFLVSVRHFSGMVVPSECMKRGALQHKIASHVACAESWEMGDSGRVPQKQTSVPADAGSIITAKEEPCPVSGVSHERKLNGNESVERRETRGTDA